nr:MAG TPA: hypothetical protein [Bacteriophage sp.]
MSLATADEILAGAVEVASEGVIQDKVLRIDNELRTISIPSTVKLLGVESDEDVNVIEFEMPRHYGEVDLSTFSIRVNYMNANGDGDIYKVTDLVADEEKMTFSWLVGRTASMYKGDTRFIVCLKKLAEDFVVKQEFNTTVVSLPVLQGLEPDEQLVQKYPDIIEQMLKFMETPVSSEEIGKAVEKYLKENPVGGATINDEEVSAGSAWSSQKTSTQIDKKVSDHNIDPAAHTDVRELISGLTNRLNALADSDDTTLDQLSEIVAYIKSNKTLIDAITTNKVSVSDIVDDLITNSSNKPLSAAQGVKLKALIDAIVPITVDSVLSSTSTNPVQNRVVLNGLNNKEDKGAARSIQIGSNSHTPNESGVINLSGAFTAADVGARADDWMPTAADVGALSGTDATLTQAEKAADAKATGDTLDRLKSDVAPLLYNNAGAHNAVYRGKNLGTSVTDAQWTAIAAGTFEDLYIGDYWVINDVTYRIAAFDYYLQAGDSATTIHHVTLVPDDQMYTHVMNDTDITTGGYVGSKMYTVGLDRAKTIITNAFGASHILTHKSYLCNAVTNGKPSGGSWYSSTVELMTEQNCYGGKIFGVGNDGSTIPNLHTVDKSQYPLFAFRPDMISNRLWFWLRDVVSAGHFARVAALSHAFHASASGDSGVRPAFSIVG